MGISRHFTDAGLQATRARLMASLQDRLAAPTLAVHNGRSVRYQPNVAEIRKETGAVSDALDRRDRAGRMGHATNRFTKLLHGVHPDFTCAGALPLDSTLALAEAEEKKNAQGTPRCHLMTPFVRMRPLWRRTAGRHNASMPNIASFLKAEISRVARKEVRAEIETLKRASVAHRALIAQLRRQVDALDKELRRAAKGAARQAVNPGTAAGASAGIQRRFSASRLAAHRAKLGLSAAIYGRLVGVSGQTIYHWEQGKARPRAAQLENLAAVRDLGPRDIAERLASR